MDSLKEIRKKLLKLWDSLRTEILEEFIGQDAAEIQQLDYIKKLLDENVTHGKQLRACLSIYTYNCLKEANGEEITKEEEKLGLISGWIIEIAQSGALLLDDLMDASDTRRGNVCWYSHPNIGKCALTDGGLLLNVAYFLLIKYFADQPYFADLCEASDFTIFCTCLGQNFDLRFSLWNEPHLSNFTAENYDLIVKYKTSIYTFSYPTLISLIRYGITDDTLRQKFEQVALLIGKLFQEQDDYIDCFGDPEETGKVGTDIKDKKCTWCIVKALELANPEQRKELVEAYAAGKEMKVKEIYKKLKLTSVFRKHEDEMKMEITKLIDAFPNALPKKPLSKILKSIHRRMK